MKKPKEKPLILIVEDSPVEVEIIKRSVAKGGYEVMTASNGFDGLESMMARKPAIVLSDINMPRMNGFEMCAAIREKKGLRDVPVMLISALSDPEDVMMAVSSGADGYITKPYDEDTLLSRIEALISAPREKSEVTDETIDIEYNNKLFNIPVNYRRQMNILLSLYENLISQNHHLTKIQVQLAMLNERLEEKVAERTVALAEEIEERIRTEEVLRKSQSALSNAQQLAHLGDWEMDIQTGKGIWSEESYRIFGFEPGAFEPTFDKFMKLIHPEDRKTIEDVLQKILSAGLSQAEFDIRIIRADGEERVVHDKLEVTTGKNGKPVKIFGVNFDITERMRMEEALARSEKRFRNIVETTNDWVWEVDENMVYTYASPQSLNILGYAPEEIVGKTPLDLMPPEEARRVAANIEETISGRLSIRNMENTNISKDGRLVVLETSGTPFFDVTGKFCGYRGIDRNITERKRSEKALVRSEHKYRTLFTNMRNGFAYCKMIFDESDHPVDWVYLEVNDAFERVIGLKREAVEGKRVTEVFPTIKDFRPNLFEIYGRVALTGLGTEFTINFDISNVWLNISVYCPQPGYFAAVFEDVTDLKKAESALQESEARHRAIMETANDAMICIDTNGKVYMWNRRAVNMFGYSEQESMGRNIHEFITPKKYQEQARSGFAKFLATGEGPIINKTTEVTALRKDGSEFPVELSVAAVKMKDGWGASAIIRDITERKQREKALTETNQKLQLALDDINKTQKMLVRSEKLAALGQLAAGVGHELKNPLNIIYTSTQLMMMEEGLADDVTESCKIITEQVMRAVKIIDNLREFARERKPETREIDLCPFIDKTMSLVAYEMKAEGIEIAKGCSHEPIRIMGDEDQLAQVFLNITNNARDSINMRKKSYSFEEAEKIGWRARFAVQTQVEEGKVKIRFEDNGVGISEENKRKLFMPFFTTKGESTGTGLGIAIALGIIENHGGTIEFESEEGNGATFTVKLPLAG